ncbi:NAD(P)/FAD-dependent oxidoreductase [Thalassobacillus sp. CUG 92003]|uniref:dihydrolipoyl dehydrogenase family protein n=1 Tax=Thalassobacillus sp. CUG 92003 TaxID=2736641 RepID=UPI0015E70BDB|nr:FAD-dependent oxidoreductase [Thalassobacillus sp. CUG 92003]
MTYDVIVIGGGAGGLTVAAGAASLGARVALVEKNEQLGGDCLHAGCIPSKALIEAANEVFHARQLEAVGIKASGKVDLGEINRRVKEAIGQIQEHDRKERFEALGIDIYIGSAVFENQHNISVNAQILSAKKIVIATGSRAMVPPIEGLKEAGYITNETVFDLEVLPERMAFIGGGPVGLEIAQAYSRLGTDVTVFEKGSAVLKQEDHDIQAKATELLEKEMTILPNTHIERCSHDKAAKFVHYSVNGREHTLEVDHIFVATGRRPNTDTLKLEQAGIKQDEQGFIEADHTLRTSQHHIFAVGDVNGSFPFTHVAGQEGKLVVQNALFNLKRKMSYDFLPWNTYITPEIFHLGMTQQEAGKAYDTSIYYTPLNEVDRFVADHADDGFIKVITDTNGKILGAHALGKGAGDWMQVLIYAVNQGAKIGDLSQMIYPYPNHAAAIETISNQYWRQKLFSGIVPKVTGKLVKWLP